MVVTGEHFEREGRLEVDGLAVHAADIEVWATDRIVLRVTRGLSSGLLRVETDAGKSNPVFLASPSDMPVVTEGRLVRINSITPSEIAPGSILSIRGFGFGPRSAYARISFRSRSPEEQLVVDGVSTWIVHWSNREIRLVVPPGLPSGSMEIAVNGEAIEQTVSGTVLPLERIVGNARSHAVHQQVAIDGESGKLRVVLPQIPTTTDQPSVQLLRQEGELLGALGTVAWSYRPLLDFDGVEESDELPSATIQRTDYVERHAVTVTIPDELPPIDTAMIEAPDFREAFSSLLGPVDGMLPNDPVISRIGADALAGYRHPLAIAQRIQEVVTARFEPAEGTNESLKRAIIEGTADARSYADLTVLIARGKGIPARRHLGVILDARGQSRVHAWVEFFIPGFGWLASDPALADGIYEERVAANTEEGVGEDGTAGAPAGARPPFGTIDDRRVSLYVDGTVDERVDPGIISIEPSRSYAPGALRIEAVSETDLEGIEVEWSPPELIPD